MISPPAPRTIPPRALQLPSSLHPANKSPLVKLWGRRILVGRGNRDPENRGVAGEIQIAAIQGMTLEGLTGAER